MDACMGGGGGMDACIFEAPPAPWTLAGWTKGSPRGRWTLGVAAEHERGMKREQRAVHGERERVSKRRSGTTSSLLSRWVLASLIRSLPGSPSPRADQLSVADDR